MDVAQVESRIVGAIHDGGLERTAMELLERTDLDPDARDRVIEALDVCRSIARDTAREGERLGALLAEAGVASSPGMVPDGDRDRPLPVVRLRVSGDAADGAVRSLERVGYHRTAPRSVAA